jgi:hypothetical protein
LAYPIVNPEYPIDGSEKKLTEYTIAKSLHAGDTRTYLYRVCHTLLFPGKPMGEAFSGDISKSLPSLR